jgi:hypothetical protein
VPSPVNCCWPSSAQSFLISGPFEIRHHIFVLFRFSRVLKWGLLFDERRRLTTIECCYIAAGPRQHSLSWFRVPRHSWPNFIIWWLWEPSDHMCQPMVYKVMSLCSLYGHGYAVSPVICPGFEAWPKHRNMESTIGCRFLCSSTGGGLPPASSHKCVWKNEFPPQGAHTGTLLPRVRNRGLYFCIEMKRHRVPKKSREVDT